MGRELRRVPITNKLADHPKQPEPDWHGRYHLQPQFDETFDDAMAEWQRDYDAWKRQEYHTIEGNEWAMRGEESVEKFYAENTFEDYVGSPPEPRFYRPPHPEGVELGIQLWEDTSEGTPQSEVFPDTEEGLRQLSEWAAVHCTTFGSYRATADEWFNMLSDGFVVTKPADMPGVMFI